jgi:predicted nucleotidyltransferase
MSKVLEEITRQIEVKKATLEQLAARKAAILARQNHKATSAERKLDTRKKVLVGAVILEQASKDASFKKWLGDLLEKSLVKENDRKLFGLEGGIPPKRRTVP